MKTTRIKITLAAALALAGGFTGGAQSNGTPGDTDYSRFSQFIAERNIFDPNRYPRNQTTTTRVRHQHTHVAGAPYVSLVGTMSYQKGLFAFFDSNNPDDKKIVSPGDEIAGYTVKAIADNTVTLLGADKKEVSMKVGVQMRQDGGTWKINDQVEVLSSPAPAESDSSTSTSDDAAAAPSPALQSNDVLKRLMQLRQKENQ
jgi:hypothetical protein